MEVQSREHDTHGWIQRRAVRDGDVVGGRDGAVESRVRAADVGDEFGVQLGFYAGFAQDKDSLLFRRK